MLKTSSYSRDAPSEDPSEKGIPIQRRFDWNSVRASTLLYSYFLISFPTYFTNKIWSLTKKMELYEHEKIQKSYVLFQQNNHKISYKRTVLINITINEAVKIKSDVSKFECFLLDSVMKILL
ncbi:hypothetical protein L9F63_024786, partial [Diploptera punctata]